MEEGLTCPCTYDELKKVASEFFRAVPSADLPGLDAGLKCLQLHFLGMETDKPYEQAGAVAIMHLATKKFVAREVELGAMA